MIGKSLLKEVIRTVHGKALPVSLISDYHAGLKPGQVRSFKSNSTLVQEPQREKLKSKLQFGVTLL